MRGQAKPPVPQQLILHLTASEPDEWGKARALMGLTLAAMLRAWTGQYFDDRT